MDKKELDCNGGRILLDEATNVERKSGNVVVHSIWVQPLITQNLTDIESPLMKKITSFAFSIFLLTLLGGCIHMQVSTDAMTSGDESETDHYKPSINLFALHELDDLVYISLSDIYHLSDDPDSIAVPNRTEGGFWAAKYTLESVYRERFLSKTGISDTDSVYIYDHSHKSLISFAVRDLRVIASLNPYVNPRTRKGPFHQHDYQIGFEVDKKALDEFKGNLWNALIYVGQESPFANEPLTPLVWNEIARHEYPTTREDQGKAVFSGITSHKDFSWGNTYLAEAEGFQYFLQDYLRGSEIVARRLLVVEPQTQEAILDRVFYESESASLTLLNYRSMDGRISHQDEDSRVSQLTGKLFKEKPSVVFGFLGYSFGCPFISVMAPSDEDITIHCDNRH